MISTTPGLIAQLRGQPTKARYKVATVFVDHFSSLSFVHVQKTTNAEETVEAKLRFEQFARGNGVEHIKHYHADNGIFADNLFRKSVEEGRQTLSFCGVNAHWQNGVAERRIRELQDHARTMLIHASKRWPQAITANLWPYALRMANDVLNSTPRLKPKFEQGTKSALEVFSNSPVSCNPKHWHPFGCPVYALDSDLAAGKKSGKKWTDRARVGIYLGQSPQHARTVSLVLNIETGNVSPQFHLKVDPTFQTMRHSFGNMPVKTKWLKKCHFEDDSSQGQPPKSEPSAEPVSQTKVAGPQDEVKDQVDQSILPASDPPAPALSQSSKEPTAVSAEEPDPQQHPQEVPKETRRSKRVRRPVQRFIAAFAAISLMTVPHQALHTVLEEFDGDFHASPLLAFAASADPDTMYLHQALKEPDKVQWIEAMKQEIQAHVDNNHWEMVPRRNVPEGVPVLPAVWAMKRKRRIATREVYKWKARLNLDGSKQVKGVNYQDTYAPVASWSTIRMVLTTSILKSWPTKQIDFVMAYTQAEVENENMFMKIPKGFDLTDEAQTDEWVLRLKKNLYGQKQAGRVWNKHLIAKLQVDRLHPKRS